MNIVGSLFKDSFVYIFFNITVYTLVNSNVTLKIIDFFRNLVVVQVMLLGFVSFSCC